MGLTGPSGAGKSEIVRRLLVNNAVVCIDMDFLARQVTAVGSDCLQRLVNAFSADILNADGTLNRKALAKIAFATPEGAQLLNRITHPSIIAETERLLSQYQSDPAVDVVILDAPLLLESGMEQICDKVIAVLADSDTRISRICLRDGITTDVAKQRQVVSLFSQLADASLQSQMLSELLQFWRMVFRKFHDYGSIHKSLLALFLHWFQRSWGIGWYPIGILYVYLRSHDVQHWSC